MNEEETELARALVALPGWEWPRGIAWVADTDCPLCYGYGGFRWRESDGSENGESCPCSGRIDGTRTWTGAIPDLHDPSGATAGALLAMLAATGRLTCVYPPGVDNDWRVDLRYQQAATGPTLGVACARALVALDAA